MKTRLQRKTSQHKYEMFYIYIPKEISRKAGWLRRQRVVEIDVDVLRHIIIKP